MKTNKKYNKKKLIFKIVLTFLFLTVYIISIAISLNIEIISNSKYHSTNNKSSKERIFLCTLYNNEAEMAYIHIWRLYDYVDKFIFVTSNITHSGNLKNISFKPFEEEINFYKDKVNIVYFNNICNRREYPNDNNNWCIEKSQRDYAKYFIEENFNPTEKDLLIVVDVDEILTKEGIKYIKKNPPFNFYYIKGSYYFPYYYHKITDWNAGYVIRYNKNMKTLSKYRLTRINKKKILKYKDHPEKPLITHCSYCFKNIEDYKNKLRSFAHQEYNRPPYNTNNWIFKSHYCRQTFKNKGFDESYEGWKNLIPDDNRLKYLIDRSFIYNINKTTYKENDLKSLCNIKYNRTPFESSTKCKY